MDVSFIYFLHKFHGLGKITLRNGCKTPYIARPDVSYVQVKVNKTIFLSFDNKNYVLCGFEKYIKINMLTSSSQMIFKPMRNSYVVNIYMFLLYL